MARKGCWSPIPLRRPDGSKTKGHEQEEVRRSVDTSLSKCMVCVDKRQFGFCHEEVTTS
jgi:hypothetical protein